MTNLEKTMSAMNSAYLNTTTMTINETYLNETLQLYIANDRSLYESMHSRGTKATSVAWAALIYDANSRLKNEEYPRIYTATSDQLKKWLSKYGNGYASINETVKYVESERISEANKNEQ